MASTTLTKLAQQCIDHLAHERASIKAVLASQNPLPNILLRGAISYLEEYENEISSWKIAVGGIKESRDRRDYKDAVRVATDTLSLIEERVSEIGHALQRGLEASEHDRLV
jgi:hypothetical protein